MKYTSTQQQGAQTSNSYGPIVKKDLLLQCAERASVVGETVCKCNEGVSNLLECLS